MFRTLEKSQYICFGCCPINTDPKKLIFGQTCCDEGAEEEAETRALSCPRTLTTMGRLYVLLCRRFFTDPGGFEEVFCSQIETLIHEALHECLTRDETRHTEVYVLANDIVAFCRPHCHSVMM